ncbi:MAG TPA: transporter substrate-binding domain-containing protein, partial [Planctomycetota bacterium]|nr:transporter substrate-binding domain-containing protein [Planctomycetota bacterium]
MLSAVIAPLLAVCAAAAIQDAPAEGVLRWGGDAEGGAPYVEADASDPSRVVGFDVEIAELVARRSGLAPQFVQVAFSSLDQSARRGDFDLALSGIEDIPARRASLAVSRPYYRFREVLTVRAADRERFRGLADLRGRSVATLGGTIAYDLLLAAEGEHGITAVSYDDDVHPYSDLLLGRVDAVLLDNILAERAMRRHEGLHTQPDAVAIGHYVVIAAPERAELMARVDAILREAMRDGTLEAIFRKWGVWNDDQPRLFAELLGPDAAAGAAVAAGASGGSGSGGAAWRYLPSLLRAAVVTLLLSCAAMALAVAAHESSSVTTA